MQWPCLENIVWNNILCQNCLADIVLLQTPSGSHNSSAPSAIIHEPGHVEQLWSLFIAIYGARKQPHIMGHRHCSCIFSFSLKKKKLLILCEFHFMHPNPTHILIPPYQPSTLETSPLKENKQ